MTWTCYRKKQRRGRKQRESFLMNNEQQPHPLCPIFQNIQLNNKMFIKKLQGYTPHQKHKIFSRVFVASIILIGLLLFTSLVITSSNYMVVNQLNTDAEMDQIFQMYLSYIISQRVMISVDVVLLLLIPVAVFSVFTFQSTGNVIIIIVYGVTSAVRWIFGLVFMVWSSPMKDGWNNMWNSIEEGGHAKCMVESCSDAAINYVICGKLQMWKQLRHFELFFLIIFVFLIALMSVLSYKSNKLDLQLQDLEEEGLDRLQKAST